MSNILVVSGLQIFPPISGGHLRTSTLCNALRKAGHDVFVYSFTGRRADYRQGKKSEVHKVHSNLKEYINRSKIPGLLQFFSYRADLPPFWLTLYSQFYLPKELRKILHWCDTLIVDFPFLYPVLKNSHKQTILNTHNIESNLYKNTFVAAMVRKIEMAAVKHSDTALFCSKSDRNFFRCVNNENNLFILPNGLDVDKYSCDPALRVKYRNILNIETKHTVLFTASSYRPNRNAFNQLLFWSNKNMQQLKNNNIVILVVGSVSDTPIDEEHIKVIGRVDDILPYFSAADSAINPVTEGSGTNVKLMEYIAAKLPILTTPFGARGIELESGKDCLYFDFDNLLDALLTMSSMTEKQRHQMAERALQANIKKIDMSHALSTLPLEL